MRTNKKITPSIFPGFMELLPREQIVFNSMLRKIQESYELFGFVPLDTPVIEKAEVLMAKGGDETEKQTYAFKKGDNDLALRFDLTVPLARYVSEHFNDLTFPFRRYQIGKVYRGEKPQKGRFREFYQCDIDIIGNGELDLVNDAEILAVIYSTFNKLELGKFLIHINNRKVLSGFSEDLGLKDKTTEVFRLIDKIDKLGKETLIASLKDLGVKENSIDKILNFISIKGSADEVIASLEKTKITNATFKEGVNDLKEVVKYIRFLNIPAEYWEIDLSIARGLEYYTGTVYETTLVKYPQIGSVCSGGRYDNLAEYYTDRKLPGVGISVGLTRLFYQLNEMNLIKKYSSTTTKLLIISLTDNLEKSFNIATQVRGIGVPTEVYTGEATNMRKKLDYANKIGVPFVGFVGENEIKDKTITKKNMKSGTQETISLSKLKDSHFE